jgi:lysophospholipase L1-like esterase
MLTAGQSITAMQSILATGIRASGISSGIVTPYFNLTDSTTVNMRAARDAVIAGTGVMKIACIGDSTEAGTWANSTDQWTDNRVQSCPAQLATLLTASGIPAQAVNWIGSAAVTSLGTYRTYYPLITSAPSGWALNTSSTRCPGWQFWRNTTTTNAITYEPAPFEFDELDVLYSQHSSANGTFQVQIDGVTVLTQNTAGTVALGKVTITGLTPGTHIISISRVSGTIDFCGCIVRNTTVKAVEVYNTGVSSMNSVDLVASNGAAPIFAWPNVIMPHMAFINCERNDRVTDYSLALFDANTRAFVTALKAASCDVCLVVGVPSKTSGSNDGAYGATLYQIAADLGCSLIDSKSKWGTWAAANANGWYGDPHLANSTHPSAAGYEVLAGYRRDVLRYGL